MNLNENYNSLKIGSTNPNQTTLTNEFRLVKSTFNASWKNRQILLSAALSEKESILIDPSKKTEIEFRNSEYPSLRGVTDNPAPTQND